VARDGQKGHPLWRSILGASGDGTIPSEIFARETCLKRERGKAQPYRQDRHRRQGSTHGVTIDEGEKNRRKRKKRRVEGKR